MEENTRGVNKLLIKAPALTTGTLMKMSVKHNIHDSETECGMSRNTMFL